jgi:hypothetical protein
MAVFLVSAGACLAQEDAQAPPDQTGQTPAGIPATTQAVSPSKQQPKRILGLMPNYRAVSAGAIPPPPSPTQAFKIATQNTFDYSSFIFCGITSLLAWGTHTLSFVAGLPATGAITGAAFWTRPMAITW